MEIAYRNPATLADFADVPADFADTKELLASALLAYSRRRAVPAGWRNGKYEYLNRFAVALAMLYDALEGKIPVAPH